jgi:hypothetical protein
VQSVERRSIPEDICLFRTTCGTGRNAHSGLTGRLSLSGFRPICCKHLSADCVLNVPLNSIRSPTLHYTTIYIHVLLHPLSYVEAMSLALCSKTCRSLFFLQSDRPIATRQSGPEQRHSLNKEKKTNTNFLFCFLFLYFLRYLQSFLYNFSLSFICIPFFIFPLRFGRQLSVTIIFGPFAQDTSCRKLN